MQTFMPYRTFQASVECLDWRRLGKQRVEAFQILQTLLGQSNGWKNHPAVKMWAGYERALIYYGTLACCEWGRRGYQDHLIVRFQAMLPVAESKERILCAMHGRLYTFICPMPWWMGSETFHESHRSNLMRKDPEHYGPLFGRLYPTRPNLPYLWPVTLDRYGSIKGYFKPGKDPLQVRKG